MTKRTNWEKNASNLLKAEIKRRGFVYEDLAIALKKIGVEKTTPNLNKTINAGKFSFSFFLQCAEAIGIKNLRLGELITHEED